MAQKKTNAKTKKTTPKTLLIVESPSKAKTIGKYLGASYKVVASVGHVRDLPKSKLGVNIEDNFEPEYISIRGKGDLIKQLKKEARDAGKIYLATDPDREGEAISWHLAYILGIDPESKCRITFNEITKDAVKNTIKEPRAIDLKLVDAQQARRVLDRLVGYQISPILWKKIKKNLSAGRVQSAALKLICDRENEIKNFIPKEYWNLSADLNKGKAFNARVTEYKGKKLNITNESGALAAKDALEKGSFKVTQVVRKETNRKPFAPFTTSSMQQDAANKIGFSTKKTMMIAQQLYEGVDIKGQGTVGLVTYIRTDSVRISDEAKASAYRYIETLFGKEYTAHNVYSNKKKEIQDAHEAIRPSKIQLDPESIRESLTKDQYNLYRLIWTRFVASQMAAAKFDSLQVSIANGDYGLKAYGSRRLFDGYQKVYNTNFDEDKDRVLPELEEGDEPKLKKVIADQKFTEPPSRYSEASLVKELEEKNIGRPSTYAPIVGTLAERGYVKRGKTLNPTELGFAVTDLVSEYFTEIVDCGFTAEMEDKLDDIESRGIEWKSVISDFYGPFREELKKAEEMAAKITLEPEIAVDKNGKEVLCENCGKPMAIKMGKYGKFLACTGFPACRNTKPIIKKVEGVQCPDCGGDIIERKGGKGKIFFGCGNYPNCSRSFWYKPINKKCPECGELLVERHYKNIKNACSNENCSYKELY